MDDSTDDETPCPGWMSYEKGFDWFTKAGFIYKGEIIPTPEEIEEIKIKRDIKKYNL